MNILRQSLFFLLIIIISIHPGQLLGQNLFQKEFGALMQQSIRASSMNITSDGGYIIGGHVEELDTTNIFNTYYNPIIIKTNASGDTMWTRIFQRTDLQDSDISNIIQTFDGGYISAISCNSGFHILKLDSIGDTLWTKFFIYNYNSNFSAFDIIQTTDGGYALSGRFNIVGSGTTDGIIMKLDAAGNLNWIHAYDGSYTNELGKLLETPEGGFIALGYTYSSGAGSYDVFLAKTDNNGNVLWTKTYATPGQDFGLDIKITKDSNYIVTGMAQSNGTSSEILLIKTDQNGDTLWTRGIGGAYHDIGSSVFETNDSCFIVSGESSNFNNGYDAFLMKFNSIGDTVWTHSYSYPIVDFVTAFPTSDSCIIALDRGLLLAKLDLNGNTNCNNSNLSFTFKNLNLTLGNTAITFTTPNIVSDTIYLMVKGGCTVNSICNTSYANDKYKNPFLLYPNPVNNVLRWQEDQDIKNIIIYDITGRIKIHIKPYGGNFINTSNLVNGVYLVEFHTADSILNQKIIVNHY